MLEFVVVRHGESHWNNENRFTGWHDVGLSEKGISEAIRAGQVLKEKQFNFDVVFTSVLKRAIHTMNYVLSELEQDWLPVIKDWRLNERHYGGLQGLNKSETAAKHGEAQVKIWRRSYDTPPPMMEQNDPRHPSNDRRYKNVNPQQLPSGESLKDTVQRFWPLWTDVLAPELKSGKKILIVAHGNSLRALIQKLENLSAAEIMEVNIPTGVPLRFVLDTNFKVVKKEFLGNAEEVEKAMLAVANQGKAK